MLCKTGRVITLAGVGAVRVKAVLIVFTWRGICGALIYIWNTWHMDCSEAGGGVHLILIHRAFFMHFTTSGWKTTCSKHSIHYWGRSTNTSQYWCLFFFWNECMASLEARALHPIRSKQSNVTNYKENTEWLTGVCFRSTTLLQALVFSLNRQPARLRHNYSSGTNSFCAGVNIQFRLKSKTIVICIDFKWEKYFIFNKSFYD